MRSISDDIKNMNFAPVYLLYGDEPYLRENYRNSLIKALVSPGDNLNYAAFTGDGTDPDEIVSLASTLPFMADKRVIYVKDSGFFKKSQDVIAEYIAAPSEDTVLIFDEETVDKRSKGYVAAKNGGYDIDCKGLSEERLKQWIAVAFKRQDKRITDDTADALRERVGDDMTTLDMEIKKLAAYAGDRSVVTKEDVLLMVPRSPAFNIFGMVDAIAAFQPEKAVGFYYDMASDRKQNAFSVLGRMEAHFRDMLIVEDLDSRGESSRDIAQTMGIQEWRVRKYMQQMRKYSRPRMISVIDSCVRADREIKQGLVDERTAMEMLIVGASSGLKLDEKRD